MIVAVHEHARLRERGLREQIHHLREFCGLVRVECQAQVAREQPVREQAHLEPEQLRVVRWQLLGVARAAHLDLDECVDRIAVKRIGTPAFLQRPQIGKRAQVGEQQEAGLRIALEHARCVHADLAQHFGDAQVRADVLPVGRRIHHDQAAARARHAEIAPEAGVGRCGRQLEFAESQSLTQPGAQLGEPRVVSAFVVQA